MKNIHVLPTDKSSRLCLDSRNILWFASRSGYSTADGKQNIYITNDEEIKEWYIYEEKLLRASINHSKYELLYGKAVVLTTDQDLINDGIQAIDDEFLEWFVKNPNCEDVDIDNRPKISSSEKGFVMDNPKYNKIIIPKEEPDYTALLQPVGAKQEYEYQSECICGTECKEFTNVKCKNPKQEIDMSKYIVGIDPYDKKETLEEVATKYSEIYRCPATNDNEYCRHDIISAINFGAKWQQERSYSEEEVLELLLNRPGPYLKDNEIKEWFEQFKKK